MAKAQFRPRPNQISYVAGIMRDSGTTNESEVWRSLIDLGIARREEALQFEDLLRICAQNLTLLRRMASGIDVSLIAQSKTDAETLIGGLGR